jgi:ribosomal protein S18 acetylase RimI-like enzyme
MDNLTIHAFTDNNYAEVELLLQTIGWGEQYIKGQLVSISNLYSSNEGEVLIARAATNLVGIIQTQHHTWNRLSQIHGLLVSPSARRNGIARTLVSRCENIAKNREQRGIYLDTPVNNVGGIEFYKALGFSVGYIMPFFYEENLDGVTLQKFFSELK